MMEKTTIQRIPIDTISGVSLILAPAGWAFDKTATIAWARLLTETRIKDFKRQRDKFTTEAKISVLALVLANAIGMADTYWVLRAREIAPLDPDKVEVV